MFRPKNNQPVLMSALLIGTSVVPIGCICLLSYGEIRNFEFRHAFRANRA
jgi:hypothetical protein